VHTGQHLTDSCCFYVYQVVTYMEVEDPTLIRSYQKWSMCMVYCECLERECPLHQPERSRRAAAESTALFCCTRLLSLPFLLPTYYLLLPTTTYYLPTAPASSTYLPATYYPFPAIH
jgi:hypothetical protein